MTVKEKAKLLNYEEYDTSLPQGWFDQQVANGFNPFGHFVWLYKKSGEDRKLFGEPGPLTTEAVNWLSKIKDQQ